MALNLNVNFSARANFGRVGAELNKMAASIRNAQGQVAQSIKAQGAAAAASQRQFAQMNNAGRSFNEQMVTMRGSTDQLANSIRKGDVNFRQLGQALRNNQQITKQQVALQRGWVQSTTTLNNGMQEVAFRTQNLDTVQAGLIKRIGTGAAAFQGYSNRLINMGKNMQWAGRQIMVGLAVPLGFFAVAAVKAAEEYDRAMTRVLKVTTFAAAEGTAAFEREVEALRRQVTEMGRLGTQMGFTSTKTAEAAAEFAQMGYQGQQLDKLTAAAQQLAFTSGTELTDAIELTRITAMAFDRDLDDLTTTFAKLNMIENNTSLSLDDMAQSMPIVAAVAHGLGVEIEEVGGLLAMMSDAGISAREGATALRTGLIRIVQEASDPAIEAFQTINLNLEEMQARNKGDTLAFLDELGTHLQNLEGDAPAMADFTAAIGKLVGTRQASRFMTFLQEIPNRTREGTAGFRAWIGATTDASEALRVYNFEYRQMAESQAGQADILRAELSTLMQQLGEPLLEIANTLRRFAISALEWFGNLSEGWQKFIKNGLAAVAVVGPLLMLGGILQNLIGQFMKTGAAITVWATRTKFLTTEQAALDAMLIKNKLTIDQYNLAMARKAALERQSAAGAAAAGVGGRHNVRNELGQFAKAPVAPVAVGTRMGLGGIASTAVGVGAVTALISDVTQGTFEWHKAIMQVGIAAMGLSPLFKKIVANFALAQTSATGLIGVLAKLRIAFTTALGPLGLVVAAVAAIAAAAWKWNKNQKEAYEALPTAADDAERLAKNLGLAWNQGGDLDENLKSVEARMMEMRKENAHIAQDIKNATSDFDKQQIIYDLGMQMVWAGNDPEEVARQLKVWAKEMRLDIDVELITPDLFSEDEHIRKQAENFGEELGHSFNNAFETSGLQGIERTIVERQAGWVQKLISTGDVNYIRDAGVAIRESFLAILNDPLGDLASKNEALKHFVNEMERAGIIMADMPNFTSTDEMQEYVNALLTSGNLISSISEQTHLNTSEHTALIRGLLNQQRQSIEQMIEAQRALVASLQTEAAANPLQSVGLLVEAAVASRKLKTLEEELGIVNDKQKELDDGAEEGFGGMADEIDKASGAISALRSAISNVQSNVVQMAMEELETRHRNAEDAMSRHAEKVKDAQREELDNLKDTQEEAVEAVEDRYDKQIDALKSVEEKENELERQRQHNFRLQKMRDDYLNQKAQGSLSIAAALARGDVDEAASINQDMRAATTDYNRTVEEEQAKFAEETRKNQRDAVVDSLEEQKEAAVEALKVEQEAQVELLEHTHKVREEQLDAAKDAAKRQNDIVRRQFQYQLDQWKKVTPRTEAEYRTHLNELGAIMGRFGGNLERVGSDYQDIFGHSIHEGFKVGTTDAINALTEDRRWEDAGQVISKRIIAGLLGEEYTPMEIGTADSWERQRRTRTRGERSRTGGGQQRFHSGGEANRSTSGAGLKPGELSAVLQTGEFVVDRDTVDKFGPEFFRGLQRFHEGGLVDHLGDLVPLQAMAHTLGAVLGGRPVEETGNLGAAVYELISKQDFSYDPPGGGGALSGSAIPVGSTMTHSNLRSPDADSTWRRWAARGGRRDWTFGMDSAVVRIVSSVLAAIPGGQRITSAYRPGATVAGTNRPSKHASGRAVDIGVLARRDGGSLESERMGDSIAATFDKTPGVRQVLWKTMTGGNHFNHVHVGFHQGGLAGVDKPSFTIPALKAGADVNFDNTLANLHRGERVLTAPLTEKLDAGLSRLANGSGTVYDVDVVIQGNASAADGDAIANAVLKKLQQTENRQGRSRRIG